MSCGASWMRGRIALTKSYSSQGPTSIDLSDIFTIDPSGNSNFRNAGTYSITVYAKAYGSNDAVEIGSATVTVTSVQRPSLSVTINGKTYKGVFNYQYDPANNVNRFTFTACGTSNETIWGSKAE